MSDDILSRYTIEAMTDMVTQKEAAIREALNSLLPGWSMGEVKDRCTFTTCRGDPCEYFCIDGRAVLQFFPMEFGQRQTETSYIITATQKVRKL